VRTLVAGASWPSSHRPSPSPAGAFPTCSSTRAASPPPRERPSPGRTRHGLRAIAISTSAAQDQIGRSAGARESSAHACSRAWAPQRHHLATRTVSAPDSLYRDAAAGTLDRSPRSLLAVTQKTHTVPLAGQTCLATRSGSFSMPAAGRPAGISSPPFRFAVSVAQLRVTRNAQSYALAIPRTRSPAHGPDLERLDRAYAAPACCRRRRFWIKRLGTGTIRLLVPPVRGLRAPRPIHDAPPIGPDRRAIVALQGNRARKPLVIAPRGRRRRLEPDVREARPPSPPDLLEPARPRTGGGQERRLRAGHPESRPRRAGTSC